MALPEPQCVAWKRLGAAHIAKLLTGKSRQEQLKFWRQRTEKLLANNKSDQPNTSPAVTKLQQPFPKR